ncbi:hypothetical protein [Enhydrobacter aerosaccus]|uniref:hypothetical protein n=1 Tax=Enhydrobacter aerosaccus TaxID=225324 RepID=UPI0011166E55|nr:hypothetical protein [Enhydrobacter aerosaccus]
MTRGRRALGLGASATALLAVGAPARAQRLGRISAALPAAVSAYRSWRSGAATILRASTPARRSTETNSVQDFTGAFTAGVSMTVLRNEED